MPDPHNLLFVWLRKINADPVIFFKKMFAFCAIIGLSIQTGVLPQDDLKGVGNREDSSMEIAVFWVFFPHLS